MAAFTASKCCCCLQAEKGWGKLGKCTPLYAAGRMSFHSWARLQCIAWLAVLVSLQRGPNISSIGCCWRRGTCSPLQWL